MSSRTKFYLNKREKKWLGVCAGLADFTGIDVLWWRVGAVVGTILGAGILPVAYLVIGLMASDKPSEFYSESVVDQKFWQKVRVAPSRSIRDVHASFRDIDRRLAHVERHYTSQNTRLAAEIDSLK
ncbi:envelope stress response membrane protein PspC [Sphingosinicella microcystinivorans]|uniref:envelope stress response membrane protein PspC n=1 Tax=Sphingosinicella microcystinivorans TaxID=335406 RepID=UPI0022F3AC4C|nr:envelope stress response membrane protein PspC [Sphingosinicella microcystinivorans]WBX85064.1 envelope stress response membrane protein PspC [Sphingosinicella microcystinivorans]